MKPLTCLLLLPLVLAQQCEEPEESLLIQKSQAWHILALAAKLMIEFDGSHTDQITETNFVGKNWLILILEIFGTGGYKGMLGIIYMYVVLGHAKHFYTLVVSLPE